LFRLAGVATFEALGFLDHGSVIADDFYFAHTELTLEDLH
jgi:hypothetical protein